MGKKQVLVVDDDPSHLKLYAWIVERGGFAPIPHLATRSLDGFPDGNIAAAVVDYKLGTNLTALDMVPAIRSHYGQIPVLVLSDTQWIPDELRAMVSGFVRKGEPQELVDSIGALLSNGHQK